MTTYGNSSDYNIAIATTYAGSAGSETPDGDIAYLLCPDFTLQYQSLMKIKDVATGTSYSTRDGKRSFSFTINNVYTTKYSGVNTNTAAFEAVLGFLMAGIKTGAAPRYLFIYNKTDATYVKNSITDVYTTQTRYMKGYITAFPVKLTSGNIYNFSLTFKECLT